MSDYARIRPAITHYENISRAEGGSTLKDRARAQFNELQNKYYSSVDNPDYSLSLTKFCYLYKYAIAHGYYVFRALRRAHEAIGASIFSQNGMRIACIGGGPGSEIVGLLRYLREVEPQNASMPIEIVVFDKEKSWEDVGKIVLSNFSVGGSVSLSFVHMDATDPRTYEKIDFSYFGIVISSFFMSETRKLKIATVSRQFWKFMLRTMRTGAWFVAVDFADNAGVGWNYLSSVIASAGRPFADIVSEPAIEMTCPDSKAAILDLENELDHRPKKNATNSIRVTSAA